jgi:hypothetical protein
MILPPILLVGFFMPKKYYKMYLMSRTLSPLALRPSQHIDEWVRQDKKIIRKGDMVTSSGSRKKGPAERQAPQGGCYLTTQ